MENTPFYFYDLELLNLTLDSAQNNSNTDNFYIHYAIKANNNKEILKTIVNKGFGADCVSGWEIEAAIEAGFNPASIAFAGVGKTDQDLAIALANKIGVIHCESIEEIGVLNEMAKQLDYVPKIALRINPNVNANTHKKISTGLRDNKFGLTALEYGLLIKKLPELNHISIIGLHFHIGSQITELSVFESLCERIQEIIPNFEKDIGKINYLNVGGGLGIDYENPDSAIIPNFKGYFNVFKKELGYLNIPIHFELGRSLVGQCGSLRTKVLFVKKSETKNFAVLDAGMTELMRPALYGAKHRVEKFGYGSANLPELAYDIVGPICESSDSFGENIILPELRRGDVLIIRSCGAYAESMSLRYNGRQEIGNNLKKKITTRLKMKKTA